MTAKLTPRRAGFTLIELLVVIGIMSLLMALAASAVFRVSFSEQKKIGETQVLKVASSFDQQWKAVVEAAKKEPMLDPENPNPADPINGATVGGKSLEERILDWSGYDNARARALWTRIRLWQEFPHRFSDVFRVTNNVHQQNYLDFPQTTVNVNGNSITLNHVRIYSKKVYFDALASASYVNDYAGTYTVGIYNLESSVLLPMILASGKGSTTTNADEK